MVRLNLRPRGANARTHEGSRAFDLPPEAALRKAVLSCLLWEDTFYEQGETIADRIAGLVPKVPADTVAALAVEARSRFKLRHVPLLLAREMLRHPTHRVKVADLLADVIDRPDEMAEFLAIYWKDGRTPVAAQAKKGLARAFAKFDAYQLAKWDSAKAPIRLRDILRIVHPAPANDERAELYGAVIAGTLPSPRTWENRLSAGEDKKAVFEDMLANRKLGALALLRNLRGMEAAGVDRDLVRDALVGVSPSKVLPFRFVTAARHAPWAEPELEAAMLRCLKGVESRLPGRSVLLIDVSASMSAPLSARGATTRRDAASGLAILARELCERVDIHTFSNRTVGVPARRGFALRDAIARSQPSGGTALGGAVADLRHRQRGASRLIVLTDEQSYDTPDWAAVPCRTWLVNLASYQPAVATDGPRLQRVDGFSEAILAYIASMEAEVLAD